jgi:methionine aminotransferase
MTPLTCHRVFRILTERRRYVSFQLAEYSAISDEPDTEFTARLAREHKVAALPISVFYKDSPKQQVIRFCFAKHDHTLQEAAGKLTGL